jgi:hypothetical protein
LKNRFIFCLILATALGLGITWIDSRPVWDDSGISALMLAIAAFFCGYLAEKKPWLIALAICIWIPAISLFSKINYGSFLALIPGFTGAYAGYFLKTKFYRNVK